MAQALKAALSVQIRRLYQAPRYFSSLNHHLQSQEVTKYVQSPDFLLSNLKNASNTRTILEMVAQHNNIMNNKHILQAMRTLFTLQKTGNSELATNEILAHKEFKRLCRKLRNLAPGIELREVIDALKVVSYVGVSSDSTIFQVLLQLIRHNVNQLNLQQVIFLDFLLQQATPSPLVDALKIALPMIFEIHLPMKLDYDNISQITECFYYASKNNISERTIKTLVKALSDHEFDAKIAKSIIWSICDLETNEIFEGIMGKAVQTLIVHFDELNFNDMETTLSKMILRYNRKSTYFYDETFFESCANYVIDKDLGFKSSIYLLRKFGRVNFFNKFLLDYMAKKVNSNPELLLNSDPVDVYTVATYVAITDYRPVHWENVKNILAKTDNVANTEKREIIWIKFAAALCLIDVFKLDVLSKCLQEDFLKSLFSKKKFMSDFENYATVWQCIKLYKPELNCLLNKEYSPEVLSGDYRAVVDFPLEGALHKALGGENYVKTDLHSKLGIQIDHAVLFRKGGYPVALNLPENLEFIEDIEVPPENQLVLILGLRSFNYTLNGKKLRASSTMSIKVLESLGHQVVPLDLELWEALPDFEKIPYIMRHIKERTDFNDLRVSESVI